MGKEQYPITKQSKFWKLFERFGVIIALVASLATVIGLLLQIRSEKRVIELQIISADQLTRLPSVSGLDGEFTYNDIAVTDLWRLRVRFTNAGDTTLIGEGAASSLMTNSIPLSFPSNVNILDASSETGVFYNLTQSSKNTLNIEFSQWRPGEEFETVIYLASDSVLDVSPMPMVIGRPIINGDIQLIDLTAKNATQPQPAIDYAPPSLALVGKILGGIIAVTIGLFSLGVLVISSPISYFRWQFWKYRYLESFQKHLNNLELPERFKNELSKNPWALEFGIPGVGPGVANMPIESDSGPKGKVRNTDESQDTVTSAEPRLARIYDRVWKDFDGPPAPHSNFPTFKGMIIGFLIGIVLTVACAAILASMIVV